MNAFVRAHAYADRSIRPAGLVEHGGWRLKRYDISVKPGVDLDAAFADAWPAACVLLPAPAATIDRPGVGLVIRHGGADADYLVLCWWDNQNELLQRVLVRCAGDAAWRDGAGRFSVCVWDLQVIWHERCAFVRHVMSPETGPDLRSYVEDFFSLGPR